MLKNLTIEGYKPFREKQEFRLAPLTLIYGPNSAGKSSLLEAIRLLFAQRESESQDPQGFSELKSRNIHHNDRPESKSDEDAFVAQHMEISGDYLGYHEGNFDKPTNHAFPVEALRLTRTSDRTYSSDGPMNNMDRVFDKFLPAGNEIRKLNEEIEANIIHFQSMPRVAMDTESFHEYLHRSNQLHRRKELILFKKFFSTAHSGILIHLI